MNSGSFSGVDAPDFGMDLENQSGQQNPNNVNFSSNVNTNAGSSNQSQQHMNPNMNYAGATISPNMNAAGKPQMNLNNTAGSGSNMGMDGAGMGVGMNTNNTQQGPVPVPNVGQGKGGMTAQQVLTHLMKMDPEQRNNVISRNPQLRAFLLQVEQQRRLQIQKMQQQQQQSTHQQPSSQQQSPAFKNTPMGNNGINSNQNQQFNAAFKPQPPQSQQYNQGHSQNQIPLNRPPSLQQQQHSSMGQMSHGSPQPPHPSHISAAGSPIDHQNQPTPSVSINAFTGPDAIELSKDKIPKKPLQKKGMKKKALSGAHVSTPTADIVNSEQPTHGMHSVKPISETNLVADVSVEKMEEEDVDLGPYAEFSNPVLENTDGWSQFLQSKGLDTTLDLKLYENMIEKDLDYLKYVSMNQHVKKMNPANINDKFGVNGRIFQRILRDLQFYQQVKNARMQSMKLPSEANGLTSKMWSDGYSGYGNGFTDGTVEFIFPSESKNPLHNELSLDGNDPKLSEDAEYVPIRLEFDVDRDGFKLNDTFTWNLNDNDETMRVFIAELIKDYRIVSNASNVFKKIYDSMKEQIAEIHPPVVNPNIDLRFPITLDITIANNQLVDRFDWDLMSQENDPEEFAEIMCTEFALPNEFQTAISHCIREQCQIYLKSLYMIGYKFDGAAIISEDLKEYLRSGIDQNNVMMPRYLLSDFTPSVQELSISNFERIIMERERESKRKKRGVTRVGRRSGFVLPDLSTMPKTFRSPLPSTIFPSSVKIIDDEKYRVDEFIEKPIEISVPKSQMDDVRETAEKQRVALENCQKEKAKTQEWINGMRSRRMRGETMTCTVRVEAMKQTKTIVDDEMDIDGFNPSDMEFNESDPTTDATSFNAPAQALTANIDAGPALSGLAKKTLAVPAAVGAAVVGAGTTLPEGSTLETGPATVAEPLEELAIRFRFGWR